MRQAVIAVVAVIVLFLCRSARGQKPYCQMECSGSEKITCFMFKNVTDGFKLVGHNNDVIIQSKRKMENKFYLKSGYSLQEDVIKRQFTFITNDTYFERNPDYTLEIDKQIYNGRLLCNQTMNMKGSAASLKMPLMLLCFCFLASCIHGIFSASVLSMLLYRGQD